MNLELGMGTEWALAKGLPIYLNAATQVWGLGARYEWAACCRGRVFVGAIGVSKIAHRGI